MNLLGRSTHCFLVAAETLNFSEAARQLGVTQQAVSKTISQFEKELGLTLFIRTWRSLQLTKAGHLCRALFTETLNDLQTQLNAIRAQAAAPETALSIGYQNYLDLTSLLSGGMARLRQCIPDVKIACERYSPAGLLDALESDRLDLILICRRFLPEHNSLRSEVLLRLPLLLMASDRYLGPGEPPDALRRAPLIIDRLENESPEALEDRVRQENILCGLAPSRIIVAPNRDSAYTCAEMGQGAILCTGLSRFLVRKGLQSYDTGAEDDLVCCWKTSCPSPLPGQFTYLLRKLYAQCRGPFEADAGSCPETGGPDAPSPV